MLQALSSFWVGGYLAVVLKKSLNTLKDPHQSGEENPDNRIHFMD
jgi:hypothetical protein